MDSLALTLIKKNMETKDPYLDLGNCGLRGDEPELELLRECTHLETLVFSNSKQKINIECKFLENEQAVNQGDDNILFQIPNSLPTNLKELYLHGNELKTWRFSDISVLQKLTKLKVLTLWGENISDISHLANLKKLECLKLRSRNISDISSISNLRNLTSLTININVPLTLDTLSALVNLKSLTLFVEKVNDLNPIKDLINLESLHIFSNKITDLLFVRPLENLKSLKFGGESILDISSIRNLKNLETLDFWGYRIKDLSEISSLKSLISLEIVPTKIVDILSVSIHSIPSQNEVLNIWKKNLEVSFKKSNPKESPINIENLTFPFRNLIEIKNLNLSFNLISDLSQLGNLSKLEILKLSHNQIKNISSKDLDLFQNLKEIELDGNPIQNIPKEIFNQWGNVLPQIKSYLKDSRKGLLRNTEVKVIFIGNGSVGKTQLAKRLSEKEEYVYNSDHDSTHGISLLKTILYSNVYHGDLILNLWDFGGQDLYHATHRMFMQTRALIILVWDAENESKDFHVWKGKEYKNHGLRYWLAYALLFAPKSPVLVLENKVDNNDESDLLPEPEKKKLKKEFSNIVGFLNCSAKTGSNFELLELEILEILENHSLIKEEIFKAELPTTWVAVRDQIRELQQSEEHIKELTKEEFQNFCKNEGIADSTNTLLGYLHDTGVLYYQNNFFNNKIIIDQAWAISSVYELFNRSNPYSERLRKMNSAKLQYQDICKIWPKHIDQERELFMGFLKDAELCFREDAGTSKNLEETTYIVPQLLSEKKPDYIEDYLVDEGLSEKYSKQYKLIPSSFIHRFIVRALQIAEVNDMWQFGVFLELNGQKAIVEIRESEKELIINYSPKGKELKEIILEELKKIKKNIPLNLGEGEKDTVREMILKGLERSNAKKKKLETMGNLKNPDMEGKKEITVFVSYSSKDRELMELLRDGLKSHLSQHPKYQFRLWSDSEIDIGTNWKESIEAAMKNSQAAILLVSANFAASEFINREELVTFFKKKKEEGFKMIPVLVRNYLFENFESLSSLQFFKTYYSDYGFNKPTDRHKLIPFDKLAESVNTTDGQLNEYCHNLAKKIFSLF